MFKEPAEFYKTRYARAGSLGRWRAAGGAGLRGRAEVIDEIRAHAVLATAQTVALYFRSGFRYQTAVAAAAAAAAAGVKNI